MSLDLPDILNQLTGLNDDSATAHAMTWLENNPTHKGAKDLIVYLERFSTQEDIVERCADWLENHPRHLVPPKSPKEQAIRPFWSTHSVNLIEIRKVANNFEFRSAQDITSLMNASSPQVIALYQRWLDTFDKDNTNVEMVTKLLEEAPTAANGTRARALLSKTANAQDKKKVLTRLIEATEAPELIQEALAILAADNDFESNECFAEAIIKSDCDRHSKQKAIDWWHAAHRNERTIKEGLAFRLGLVKEESIAAVTIAQLKKSTDENAQLFAWTSLLVFNCNDWTIAECWHWLTENQSHKFWEGIFDQLLVRALAKGQKIPLAAITEIWRRAQAGDNEWVEYLLKFDKGAKSIDYVYDLIKREAQNNKPIDSILASLIEADPSEEKLAFATNWLQSNHDGKNATWKTLEVLLKVNPSDSLSAIARQQLIDKGHQSSFLHMLVKMVELVGDQWSIKLARVFMERECRYGIRLTMGHDCAPLLILLLKIDENNQELSAQTRRWAQQWLAQFGSWLKEDAVKLQNALIKNQ